MDTSSANKEGLFMFPSGVVTRGPHLSGVAAEDINCRCDVIVEIPEIDQSKLRQAKDPETGENVNVKNMDFDEWARINKIKFHESVRVMAPEKLISKGKYVELHKGEKSWRALYYDWSKLKIASGQELTASQLKFYKANFAKYDPTSIRVKGSVVIKKPLTIPKPKPVAPPVEVKFSEGVLKTDNFAKSEGWEARHEAHKAALKQRMGFDLKEVSMQKTDTPEFGKAQLKFKKAVRSFTKPKADSLMADNVFISGEGNFVKFEKGMGTYENTLNQIAGDKVIKHYNQQLTRIQVHKRGYRASASQSRIDFSVADNIGTQFHEYGHLLEREKAARWKARKWVRARGNNKQTPLNEISFYSDKQLAYADKFIDPYVGKIYQSGSTEVLSMGMQQFTSDTSMMRFAKKDFDHFAFVHGILTGAI